MMGIIIAGVLVAGIVIGWLMERHNAPEPPATKPVSERRMSRLHVIDGENDL